MRPPKEKNVGLGGDCVFSDTSLNTGKKAREKM